MLKDQKELLSAFNAHSVEYVVIGGHAVSEHSQPRATKDLDILIRADQKNSEAVYRALVEYGTPVSDLSPADLHNNPESILQIGVEPSRVDILQSIPGVTFDQVWANRVESFVDEITRVYFISREDLIANKLAVGRNQDLADVEKMREAASATQSEIG
jgi:hypothetical protein